MEMQIQNLYWQFVLKKQNEITLAAPDLQKKIKNVQEFSSAVHNCTCSLMFSFVFACCQLRVERRCISHLPFTSFSHHCFTVCSVVVQWCDAMVQFPCRFSRPRSICISGYLCDELQLFWAEALNLFIEIITNLHVSIKVLLALPSDWKPLITSSHAPADVLAALLGNSQPHVICYSTSKYCQLIFIADALTQF